jgi:anti-sigma regulatory factor (Ser/Thr protein kinase)
VSYLCTSHPRGIVIALVDKGWPFDPLTRKDPTKPTSIQEAKIGGLGIFMTKKSVDDIAYMRAGDKNVVVFGKMW